MKVLPATHEAAEKAASALLSGDLVILPTETVYGLAGAAQSESAVRRIFAAKGRPSENPIIVHVASTEMARSYAAVWSESAEKLAQKFWPGPLTLVVPKSAIVSDLVSSGLATVGLRVPNKEISLEVIRLVGSGLAIPSANRFMQLSPTIIAHIDPLIGSSASLAIDAGACEIGLESTVLDLASEHPRVLRPGAISAEQLSFVAGVWVDSKPSESQKLAPGMYARHYSPKARVTLVERIPRGAPGLCLRDAEPNQILMPTEPATYGSMLYDALFQLDARGYESIFVELPPDEPGWEAVLDRLTKAAGRRGISR